MNKTLKFASSFIKTILQQKQIITARLFDEKNLSVGDTLDLLNTDTGERFATAKVIRVTESSFKDMVQDAADVPGMYEMYENYYQKTIQPTDTIKYVTLEMIDTND